MLTDHLPRVSLAHLPTPLEEMPRLCQALGGGPRLFIKRDDQTGLATGGNKTRKLEFLLAEALAQGAEVLITTGGPQSNHCRQVAAAAAKLGLLCVLVIGGNHIPKSNWQGNLFLDDLFGAEIRWCGSRSLDIALAEEAEILRSAGTRLYVIPLGGSVPTGIAGYVAAVEELAEQLTTMGERVNRIVLPSGSGGTQAGILVGVKALGIEARVEGMNNHALPELLEVVKTLTQDTATHLNLDLSFSLDDFILHDACGLHGYGEITDAEREASRLIARTEGIIVDPVYTGRALGGLIELVRRGIYQRSESVLFWHTGGSAGLFPRAAEIINT